MSRMNVLKNSTANFVAGLCSVLALTSVSFAQSGADLQNQSASKPAIGVDTKHPQEINIALPTEFNKAMHIAGLGTGAPAPLNQMSMPLVAPLFLENGLLSSIITMVNEADKNVSAKLRLIAPDGHEIMSQTVAFGPHAQKSLKIADLLASVHSVETQGWVELTPDPTQINSMAIAAQLSMSATLASTPSYVEEEFVMRGAMQASAMSSKKMPDSLSAHTVRAVTSSNSYPLVAIVNAGDVPKSAIVSCVAENASYNKRVVRLEAQQLVLANPCASASQRGTNLLNFTSETAATTVRSFGIDVTTQNDPEKEVLAYGIALSNSALQRDLLALNFRDLSKVRSSDTVFTGVPVGQVDLLPNATFKPELAVTNFSGNPAHVSVTRSHMNGETPSSNLIAQFTLAPGSTTHVSLDINDDGSELRNSFIVSSDQSPGSVESNLISRGGAPYGAVQLIGKDKGQDENGGGHPWTIENGMQSTLLLYNHSNQPRVFTVNLSASGKTWQKTYTLNASETKRVSINEIVHDRLKGDRGPALPDSALSGDITWFTADTGQGTGRLLVSSVTDALARNFSCGYNIVLCGAGLYSYQASFNYFNTGSLGPIYPQMCSAWSPTSCSGDSTGSGGGGFNYSWSSLNPSIAPVSGSPNNQGGTYFGQMPGTAYGEAQISNQYCQAAQSGTNIVRPTVQIQVQSGFLSMAGNGLVLLGGPGGITTTSISAVGNPGGGTVNWTAGPMLQIAGAASQNASVSGTAPSASGGDTYVSVAYTINGQTATASLRLTVLSPTTASPYNYPGGAKFTVPFSLGNYTGYKTTITYFLYDQLSPSSVITLPGIPFTEVLSTISNPFGVQFDPPDNTPKTVVSSLNGDMTDELTAIGPGGVPQAFSASRSQNLSFNGFLFSPAQQQTYNSSFGSISVSSLHR